VKPTVAMELSRQAAIKRMVEEDMGVGIVPLESVKDEVQKGRLVRWWIEGAQINWELGLATLIRRLRVADPAKHSWAYAMAYYGSNAKEPAKTAKKSGRKKGKAPRKN